MVDDGVDREDEPPPRSQAIPASRHRVSRDVALGTTSGRRHTSLGRRRARALPSRPRCAARVSAVDAARAPELRGGAGGKWTLKCPFHRDRTPSAVAGPARHTGNGAAAALSLNAGRDLSALKPIRFKDDTYAADTAWASLTPGVTSWLHRVHARSVSGLTRVFSLRALRIGFREGVCPRSRLRSRSSRRHVQRASRGDRSSPRASYAADSLPRFRTTLMSILPFPATGASNAGILPVRSIETFHGFRLRTEEEAALVDFPYPPEPDEG